MKIRSKIIRLLPVLVSVVGIILMLEWAPYHTAQPAILSEPFPATNGYDDLVAAGKMVGTDVEDVTNLDLTGLRQLVARDADAISRARLGISRVCRVPLDFHPDSTTHLNDISSFNALAYAFVTEGKLAELENRFGDAARSYLDIIKVGDSLARGGAMIDQMIGVGCEQRGTKHLKELAGHLDASTCRETSKTLESLDAQRQPWQQVLLMKRYWTLRAFPGVKNRLAELFTAGRLKKAREQVETSLDKIVEKTRILLVTLAARAYQLEKGHAPATVDDLVPDYLKAVPQDPVTGKPIAFNP